MSHTAVARQVTPASFPGTEPKAFPATPEGMLDRLKSDLSGKFAPPLAHVEACIRDARAIVAKGPYHRKLLLSALAAADPGDGRATWHARTLLCRLAGEPHLPAYLDEPFTTRGDVLRLLVRAARVFGVPRRGGWSVTVRSPRSLDGEGR